MEQLLYTLIGKIHALFYSCWKKHLVRYQKFSSYYYYKCSNKNSGTSAKLDKIDTTSNCMDSQNFSEKLRFSCEIAHYRKSPTAILKRSFGSIEKILFLGGRLGTRLYFHEVLMLFLLLLLS